MSEPRLNVVTGAFGFTGRYIARMLLAEGERVCTITGRPDRSAEFGSSIKAMPFNFHDPALLTESLKGADTLFNTYWIRYESRGMTFDTAVENSRVLIRAAADAGVRRIVHISIANPSAGSDLPYYRGKALVEQAVVESGVSYAILRPTVLFGGEGVLINNIAWFLRRMPVFVVPGSGDYQLQPTHVEDLAGLAVSESRGDANTCFDAVGPEAFAFNDLLRLIAAAVRARARIVHLPPGVAALAAQGLGAALRDTVLTTDEVTALMRNLLVSHEPPRGRVLLSNWIADHADTLGAQYISDARAR